MLHVTNGDSAAQRLRAAGLGGDVLPWRDVLHEGPVPAGLDEARLRVARARFIAALGWAAEERILADMTARDERLAAALATREPLTLWFETDLYDMLQLAQILDRCPANTATLVIVGEGEEEFTGVAELTDQELKDRDGRARELPANALLTAEARALWGAFRAPEPDGLIALARSGTPALPALAAAARRHLEQFPHRGSGLNRTERALLEAVRAGASTPVAAFQAQQRGEERPFLGDATAFEYLRRLGQGRGALLDSGPPLALTPLGEAVLDGRREWEERPERWLGGVRLPAGPPRWRYDPARGSLASS